MTTRTREEIAAELDELRAEKERRRDEKIAKGATPRVFITSGFEREPEKVGPGEVEILRVLTGVPRGDDLVPESEPVEAVMPARYNYPIIEPGKSIAPAPPVSSAPRRIRVQTQAPSGDNMGAVEEFTYLVTGGTLNVYDHTGMPAGSVGVSPGDDFEAAARRVASRCRGKNSEFWRQLN